MRERESRDESTLKAVAIVVALAASLTTLPASAQLADLQTVWLSFDDTSQLGDIAVGQGLEGVVIANAGATTAGGVLRWVVSSDRVDHLGMRHVYYRQEYDGPQVGRSARVVGTGIALHYAPDGSLRWVRGAQLPDVTQVAPLTLSTAAHAFAAGQLAGASWPGFSPGDPSTWPAGTLADLLSHAELVLVPEGGRALRPAWGLWTYATGGEVVRLGVDGSTGALLSVSPGAQPFVIKDQFVDCSPSSPGTVAARVQPQSETVWDGQLRPTPDEDVSANPELLGNETNCGPDATPFPCTHEAVWEGVPGLYPQVEVYHGSSGTLRCLSPTHAGSTGNYIRVGLKVVGSHPTYDDYASTATGHYRNYAGDAMLFTRRAMEVFWDEFGRCSFDGMCGVARVVVSAFGCGLDNAFFNYSDAFNLSYPQNAVRVCLSSDPPDLPSMSAAQDILAHEWGHAVGKHSPSDFYGQCSTPPNPVEPCEMAEGFADVVGHAVEWLTQPDPTPSRTWETRDWIAGEDWNPASPMLRRADEYDTRACDEPDQAQRYRYSVHREDTLMCERGFLTDTFHSAGNRLAVVLRLLADGGANPGCSYFGNCHIEVDGIGIEPAARILFRVLDTQSDPSTTEWRQLPFLALDAAFDLFHDVDPGDPCAFAVQHSVLSAFKAVGYGFPEPPFSEDPPYRCDYEE